MALKKLIQTQIGINADYWRISRIDYSVKIAVYFSIQLFISHEARLEGKQPVEIRHYVVNAPEDPSTNIIQYIYAKLKEGEAGVSHEDKELLFINAIDV